MSTTLFDELLQRTILVKCTLDEPALPSEAFRLIKLVCSDDWLCLSLTSEVDYNESASEYESGCYEKGVQWKYYVRKKLKLERNKSFCKVLNEINQRNKLD